MAFARVLKSLRRTPMVSVAVLVSLVLGSAAVGSMFAIVHGVLLAPLPYGNPDRLISISLHTADQRTTAHAPGFQLAYERYARRLDGVALYRTGSANVWNKSDGGASDSVTATWVSASMMRLLQVAPLLGRSFTAEEALRGGPNAVILSESEWRTRFNAAPDVIGKTLIVNDAPREVVGVMPARFAFPSAATRVWLPAKRSDDTTAGEFIYAALARMTPDATVEQAQRELVEILPKVAEFFPRLQAGGSTATWLDETKASPVVQHLHADLTQSIAPTLWMLAAAAGLVLLVAWANVANLMLVRADASQLEFAVREALGASRLRAALHFLGESVLLGVPAAILALLLSQLAIKALVRFGPADVPRLAELTVGLTTAGFITLVTMAGVILCAALPLIRARQGGLLSNLYDGGRGQSIGASRQRLRSTLAVLQIALALVALIGSALLLRTAHRLHEIQPGFDANEVTTLRILLPYASYGDASTVDFFARLTDQVRQLPSVRAAGLTGHLPLGAGWSHEQSFRVDGDARTVSLQSHEIGDDYFAAMRILLLAGRDFRRLGSEQDGDVIISQRAALTLFGDTSGATALGKQLTAAANGPSGTIIGVVGDVRDRDLAIAASAAIYRPQALPTSPGAEPRPRRSMVLAVRSSESLDTLVPAIRQIVRDLDPAVPIFDIGTMGDVVRASTARLRFMLALISAAAVITLLLGMIGLYGVMAYMVALRTREFGIRVALGANPARIARLVMSHTLMLTAAGVTVGFVLYAISVPILRAFLYGVTAGDPLALAAATLVLVCTAITAGWIPAMLAARVEPVEALRAE